MRNIAQILGFFVLQVVVSALWRVTPFEVVAPDLALLFVLYLGLTAARTTLWEATVAALMIGYVADVLAGAPRGFGAFLMGLLCIVCRLTTARLLVRGSLFIFTFAFLGSLVASVASGVLRWSLDAPVGRAGAEVVCALGTAVLTAAVAPSVLRLCRAIDARFARTQREREALRDGYQV
jgi:cell shape-determining protein MreD